ncbi:GlxA family transcriptional regulator [Cochlodiniinecator piscidefendens]|uniref:GlxA family transcriptional regulator n=1 Tax=Cochlodiniinecator piscidefendens TaxID=2715756 RepID=UPI001409E401|nr:GlxA family transcriptional regulator [Cochlodiniinecator piscidefendens]
MHIHFILLPRYPVLSLATAQETLQSFNLMAGEAVYRWSMRAAYSETVVSSLGPEYPTGTNTDNHNTPDAVVVVSGLGVEAQIRPSLLSELRSYARHGVPIIGLCTGAFVLAKAGLLEGRTAAIHWSYRDGFSENFPNVRLENRLYTFDGMVGSTAGGVSAIDIFLDFIARKQGEKLSSKLAEFINYKPIRDLNAHLDIGLVNRCVARHPTLVAVLSLMEDNIEDPISIHDIARQVGVSTRQLERLFRTYVGRSPLKFYVELRISRARGLLAQTSLSITEVAIASGFSSVSTFSKRYRSLYGERPSHYRTGRPA